MLGSDIMQVLPLIKKECRGLKIIILTMYTAPSTYLKDMMQWTEGCLNFTANEDDIIRGIETVYCGGYYFHLYGYQNKLTEDE
jgi:DNA-binding NarL/FixJ family response regulator